MAESVPHHVLLRLRKLALLPDEARHCQFAVSITRLTILKSLCQNHEVADRFVIHLARKTIEKVALGKSGSTHPATPTERNHHDMMVEAIDRMEAWRQTPSEKLRQTLYELLGRMRAEQNEHRNIPYGAVRLITDSKLLLVEYALESVLSPER